MTGCRRVRFYLDGFEVGSAKVWGSRGQAALFECGPTWTEDSDRNELVCAMIEATIVKGCNAVWYMGDEGRKHVLTWEIEAAG